MKFFENRALSVLKYVFRIDLETLYHLNRHQNVKMISINRTAVKRRKKLTAPESKSTLYILIMTLS